MAERAAPKVYSIAAHRGFADALVAGLVPRYAEPDIGLARLTLLLPSTRAVRTVTEAFVRHSGARGMGGLLMPRMAVVGDLDLDETLGALLDPLGAADIPPAVEPTRRWLRLAELIREEQDNKAPRGAALLRQAEMLGRTMDRLLAEEIGPQELLGERVLDLVGDLADHWRGSLHLFAAVQVRWLAELAAMNAVDAAQRRNLLFRHAARRWQAQAPATPVLAAGVTSAAPALADLLRVVADMPDGAVILPDFDLTLDEDVWHELGRAGIGESPDDPPFARGDAVTHPQYHLKLLLNRMGVARGEVQPWHRKGETAGPPERSHAIGSLFLPPEASKSWAALPPEKRSLAGVRLMETANPEEEAQAVALLVRETLAVPEKRVAVVTPDRNLARRIAQHLRRWNVEADDTAGRPLSQTVAGRVLLLLAEVLGEGAAPVPLLALLQHPLVHGAQDRANWLRSTRRLELALRGPRPAPGLAAIRAHLAAAEKPDPKAIAFLGDVDTLLAPLMTLAENEAASLADLLDALAATAETLCGDDMWAREDGRALSAFVEDLRLYARDAGTRIDPAEIATVLRDAMEKVAVRPPYGSHPRVAIYGLLESRMTRADLVICAGLNEGSWPARPSPDPLLASPVLRALGVPGADFRIGLAAHDLAGALGAPEVVLSRAARDAEGPAIPSRFLLRARALLGGLLDRHEESVIPALARTLDDTPEAPRYPRPAPVPDAARRKVRISVTALDRLRSDPYQFYAGSILRLKELDTLDAEPTPAWQGQVAHTILEKWHETQRPLAEIAREELAAMNAHPILRTLWEPRLMRALEWVAAEIDGDPSRTPALFEKWGQFERKGIEIFGRIDRLDRFEDGSFAVVDYKTGGPPTGPQVEKGYALQLGTLGLMVEAGGFDDAEGEARAFEYWSLAKSDKSDTGFGYVATPLKVGGKRSGIEPDEFLPTTARYLDDALDRWILGSEPFTARLNPDAAGYGTYDQLMRLEEWMGREAG